jgi:OOP family OmpA-OmpF porin
MEFPYTKWSCEMNKKLLGCALLLGIGMTQSAAAQSYDDRWYVAAGLGVGFFDKDRHVGNELYGNLGIGKFVSPNLSVDLEAWHSNPELDNYDERNWELMSLSLVGRYHFIKESRGWNPYVAFGVGAQERHDGTPSTPPPLGVGKSRTGTDMLGILGFGIQGDLGYMKVRGEAGMRFDRDDAGANQNNLCDAYAGVSLLFPIGALASPAPAPVVLPPQKTCADLDDDGDGVNNCNDRCYASPAGQAVGADGCPVPAPEPEPEMAPKPFRG